MIRKIYNHLHAHRFIHYFVAGGSAFVLDFLTLLFVKEFFKLSPTIAVVCNQIIVVVYVFCIHKFWSFKVAGDTRRQMGRFVLLLIGNYLFSVLWMWFWVDGVVKASINLAIFGQEIDVAYLAVRTFNIILAVSWNFFLYKFWVYKDLSTPSLPLTNS